MSSYELVRLIGSGAVSEVYEATRTGARGFSRRVALKRILPQHRRDSRLVEMFITEARISASLSHPNLVHVLDFGECDGELFLVMEYVDGVSCRDLLCAVEARQQRVELGPALHIVREVLQALEFLHTRRDDQGTPQHLVHRDVVPGNVLLDRAGQVKVADFGIMQGDTVPSRTEPGEIRGRVGYISPEQARGESLDARSDLFMVGVLLAELLIGGRLFAGDTQLQVMANAQRADLSRLRQHGGSLPTRLRLLVEALLAPRATDRPESARLVVQGIERIAEVYGFELTDHALGSYLRDSGLVALTTDVRDCHRQVAPAAAPTSARPGRRRGAVAHLSTLPPRRQLAPAPSEAPATLRDVGNVIRLDRRVTTLPPPEPLAATYRLRSTPPDAPPLPLARLLELIATGRVPYAAELSRDGGPFQPLGSFAELARLAGRAPYRFSERLETRAARPHEIQPGTVARILFTLVRKRRTGLFCAKGEGRQVRIYLAQGAPVYTTSTDPSHLLGECLIRGARLDRSAVEGAIESAWGSDRRIGTVLVERGLAHPNQVVAAAVEQRRERLVSVLRWTTGTAFFLDGLECGQAPSCPPVAPLPLLTDAVQQAFTLSDLNRLLDGFHDAYIARAPAADQLTMSLGLSLASARALSRAHFAPTLEMLVQTLAHERVADPRETLQAVFVGLSVGALFCEGWERLA